PPPPQIGRKGSLMENGCPGGPEEKRRKRTDEARREAGRTYRFGYRAEFMGLGPADVEAIHGAAAHLAALVPALVDTVYVKLFRYDATKRHFVPRQHGYDGPVPASLGELAPQQPMIAFRNQHLGRYCSV